MKKIDRYILGKFMGTFVFIMALLLGITIVIDLSEKIDDLVENHASVYVVVFEYFVYFIPYITSLIGPFFVLVSVIFFTSQLASRSEIIAILNSGTSFYRMLYPYMVGATIVAMMFFFGNHYFVPFANAKRIKFEQTYISKPRTGFRYSFHRTVAPNTIVYMENYSSFEASGYKFSIDRFDKGKLVYKMRAERADWDSTTHKWKISNYYIRELKDDKHIITKGAVLDSAFSFKPSDFALTENFKDAMTTPQLKKHIAYMYESGQPDIEFYEVERFRRTSSAFSIYILTLIGVSVASRKMRGGLGWHLVLGIGLSALYEIVMKFSITFATNSNLPPVIAVWIPNIIFGLAAFYLIKKAPK